MFNTILGWVGLGPQPWLQSRDLAMPSLVLEATWAAAGGTVIIYLAALLSVPAELYDAAEVDGASASGARSGTSRCRSCAASCSSR